MKFCNGSVNDFPFERDNLSAKCSLTRDSRNPCGTGDCSRMWRMLRYGLLSYLAIGLNTIAQIAVSGLGVMSEDVYGW